MIFRPLNPNPALHKSLNNERYVLPFLAFVEWFDRGPLDPETQMYTAKKARTTDGTRKCDIIKLEHVVQPCPLAPRYNGSTPMALKSLGVKPQDCIEFVEEFWINCFFSKSIYQTVY